ncbi:MAG: hypothetical protein HQL13_04125 [Candidatus Omnitrophica bacterium]|nr:hypothetical protein [Candidatus Omnitrophota bacterium]
MVIFRKFWEIFFKVIILMIGVIAIAFDGLLYNFCERQKMDLNSIKEKQDSDVEFNNHRTKYQQEQMERMAKQLEALRSQMKAQEEKFSRQKEMADNQREALIQAVERSQQVDSTNKALQRSITDLKAEADALKAGMKSWQKDYVDVLAQLQKGVNNIQDDTSNLRQNINAINVAQINQEINSLQERVNKLTNASANQSAHEPRAAVLLDKKTGTSS